MENKNEDYKTSVSEIKLTFAYLQAHSRYTFKVEKGFLFCPSQITGRKN